MCPCSLYSVTAHPDHKNTKRRQNKGAQHTENLIKQHKMPPHEDGLMLIVPHVALTTSAHAPRLQGEPPICHRKSDGPSPPFNKALLRGLLCISHRPGSQRSAAQRPASPSNAAGPEKGWRGQNCAHSATYQFTATRGTSSSLMVRLLMLRFAG